MQPPLHVTGNPTVDWIIFVIGVLVCLYWLRALRLAREGARLFLRNLVKGIVVFGIVMVLLASMRLRTQLQPNQEQLIAGCVALFAFYQLKSRKRSRHISQATRRAVIERDLGEQYDPRKHHIDHVWPHSKGGSNTTDNLRVLDKKKNLRKGAKRPKITEMWQ